MQKDLIKLDGIGYSEVLNNPLLPTSYLANVNYYAILLQHSNCKIEQYEYFIKQSIRNRCEIYGANGKLRLTIPIQRTKNTKTIIKDTKISYTENWQKLHWQSILSAYNSSPFFKYYKHKIEPSFQKKELYLIDFNNKTQNIILSILEKKIKYTNSSEYNTSGNFTDLREHNWKNQIQTKYDQVFSEKHGFIANLSILDLLFNLGPESTDYLHNLRININI